MFPLIALIVLGIWLFGSIRIVNEYERATTSSKAMLCNTP